MVLTRACAAPPSHLRLDIECAGNLVGRDRAVQNTPPRVASGCIFVPGRTVSSSFPSTQDMSEQTPDFFPRRTPTDPETHNRFGRRREGFVGALQAACLA